MDEQINQTKPNQTATSVGKKSYLQGYNWLGIYGQAAEGRSQKTCIFIFNVTNILYPPAMQNVIFVSYKLWLW
jgi:hypothetical protein